jgi:hypothetical protein
MAKPSPRNHRDLCISANEGSVSAIRALLRYHGKPQLAAEVKRGRPLSPHVKRMIGAIGAGVGTRTELSEWEEIDANGRITNLLDPHDGKPPHLFIDEEKS